MKKVTGISLQQQVLKSSTQFLRYRVNGEKGAIFSLQVKDSSSPNKFYNFVTDTFTNTFTSENTLQNIVIDSGSFEGRIKIPAASGGAEYRFLVLVDPFFNSQATGQNSFLLTKDITQEADVTVRFSTASDQAATNFEGLGVNVGSVSGSANQTAKSQITITDYSLADAADGLSLGYKFEIDLDRRTHKVADSLQPIDSDFFTSQSKTTSGSGSSATAMVLTNVDNLAVGMSLVSITSSTVTTSGSLGVLTFPTITAIDTDTKTVTLSSAHSWADNKAVVFRAYGTELIADSTGGVFEFNNFNIKPVNVSGVAIAPDNFGTIKASASSTGTSIAIDNIRGVSAGSRIFGSSIDTSSNKNLITAVHASGTPITVNNNQIVRDNMDLTVLGSSAYVFINGSITILTFPSISTDIFYDIDRAVVLATLS
mgnify:FL=1